MTIVFCWNKTPFCSDENTVVSEQDNICVGQLCKKPCIMKTKFAQNKNCVLRWKPQFVNIQIVYTVHNVVCWKLNWRLCLKIKFEQSENSNFVENDVLTISKLLFCQKIVIFKNKITVYVDCKLQTCTDSHFFKFPYHHDSFDWYWIQFFDDSFTTKILWGSTPDSLCREKYPQDSILDSHCCSRSI